MQYYVKNTLAYHRSAPYFRKFNISQTSVYDLGKHLKGISNKMESVNTEFSALEFYTLNHLMHLIEKRFTPYEVLPEWAQSIANDYIIVLRDQSKRLFYYAMLITLNEARHFNDKLAKTNGNKLLKEYPAAFEAIKTSDGYLYNPENTNVTIGELYQGISSIFNDYVWGDGISTSFGGKKWGQISDCVLAFLKGEITAEMLVDTGFTLAHNGGSMFNKGYLYESPNNIIYPLLDCQRSGQIPELILDPVIYDYKLQPMASKLKKHCENVKTFIGGIGAYCDWNKVVPINKHHTSYLPGYIEKQETKYGSKDGSYWYNGPTTGKVKMKKGTKIEGEWVFAPNQFVTIYDAENDEAAA